VPIVYGFAIGHGLRQLTVPLGIPVRLDADRGTITFLEAATTT
jgi:muramoyltetrapeptide carboxypeptidase